MKPLLILCALFAAGATLFAQDASIGPPPGRLIDVGGRKLHVHCTGAGAPTVVIEAGASSFALDFSSFNRRLLGRTACARTTEPGWDGVIRALRRIHRRES